MASRLRPRQHGRSLLAPLQARLSPPSRRARLLLQEAGALRPGGILTRGTPRHALHTEWLDTCGAPRRRRRPHTPLVVAPRLGTHQETISQGLVYFMQAVCVQDRMCKDSSKRIFEEPLHFPQFLNALDSSVTTIFKLQSTGRKVGIITT